MVSRRKACSSLLWDPVYLVGVIVVGFITLLILLRASGFLRSSVAWICKTLVGDAYFASLFSDARKRTVSEYWKAVDNKEKYVKLFYEEVRGDPSFIRMYFIRNMISDLGSIRV